MSTLNGKSVASTYDQVVKRQDSYSATGNQIEIMDDSGVIKTTPLYLDSVNSRVGIGTDSPGAKLAINTNSIPWSNAAMSPQSPQFISNGHILTRNSLRDGTQIYIGGGATDVTNPNYFLAFAGMGVGHNTISNGDTSSFLTFSTAGDNNFNEKMRITSAGLVGIGDDLNAGMTQGLTINQGASDDEILAFKSSDVAHGITDYAETDTYGILKKVSPTSGGLSIQGFSESNSAMTLIPFITTADTTKSTSARGALNITPILKSGTGGADLGADGNLVTIQLGNSGTSRFIFDVEGSGHADVEWVTFSDSRLKSSIEDVPYGLAEVLQLQPKRFDKQSGCFDENGDIVLEDNKRKMIGFLAQDVKAIIPEMVKDVDKTESFYSMDDGKLMAVLVKAVQELTAKVTALENA